MWGRECHSPPSTVLSCIVVYLIILYYLIFRQGRVRISLGDAVSAKSPSALITKSNWKWTRLINVKQILDRIPGASTLCRPRFLIEWGLPKKKKLLYLSTTRTATARASFVLGIHNDAAEGAHSCVGGHFRGEYSCIVSYKSGKRLKNQDDFYSFHTIYTPFLTVSSISKE